MRISVSGALWRHADFLRLWAAQAISTFGARIAREGLPYAAVLTVQASPMQLGVLAAVALAPGLIVGTFAGSLVDRSRKRGLMIASDLLRALMLITVPLAAWFHVLAMSQLLVVAFLVGIASVVFDIADHAFLPSLIPKPALTEGNAKLGTTEAVAEIAGPAITGLLVQLLTAPLALALNAATYLGSALFLFAIRHRETLTEKVDRFSWRGDAASGIRALVADPVVRPLSLLAIVSPFFGMFFGALYVVYALRTLQFSPSLLGVTIAVGGVGSLIGAAIARPMEARFGPGPAIVLATLGSAASVFLIPFASGPMALRAGMMMGAQLVGDTLGTAIIIIAVSLRQTIVPRHLLGRSAGVLRAGAAASGILGSLAAGALATALGARSTLLVAAIGYGVTPLIAILSPLTGVKALPQAET